MSQTLFEKVNDLSFRCRIDGTASRNKPWLIFSNSLLTDLRVWDDQVSFFSNRYRILRYDQRGHGGTDVPEHPCDFTSLADDVAALADRFGITRCTFVGLSMGVPTGLQLVSRRPDLVERIVLCNGQAGTANGGADLWETRIRAVRAEGLYGYVEDTLRRWFSPEFSAGHEDKTTVMRNMMRATPVAGFIAATRALQTFDLRHTLAGIQVPVLMIAGARDGGLPEVMRTMQNSIPNAAYVEIGGAGHIPNVEQPDAFNRELENFLASTTSFIKVH